MINYKRISDSVLYRDGYDYNLPYYSAEVYAAGMSLWMKDIAIGNKGRIFTEKEKGTDWVTRINYNKWKKRVDNRINWK